MNCLVSRSARSLRKVLRECAAPGGDFPHAASAADESGGEESPGPGDDAEEDVESDGETPQMMKVGAAVKTSDDYTKYRDAGSGPLRPGKIGRIIQVGRLHKCLLAVVLGYRFPCLLVG